MPFWGCTWPHSPPTLAHQTSPASTQQHTADHHAPLHSPVAPASAPVRIRSCLAHATTMPATDDPGHSTLKLCHTCQHLALGLHVLFPALLRPSSPTPRQTHSLHPRPHLPTTSHTHVTPATLCSHAPVSPNLPPTSGDCHRDHNPLIFTPLRRRPRRPNRRRPYRLPHRPHRRPHRRPRHRPATHHHHFTPSPPLSHRPQRHPCRRPIAAGLRNPCQRPPPSSPHLPPSPTPSPLTSSTTPSSTPPPTPLSLPLHPPLPPP